VIYIIRSLKKEGDAKIGCLLQLKSVILACLYFRSKVCKVLRTMVSTVCLKMHRIFQRSLTNRKYVERLLSFCHKL